MGLHWSPIDHCDRCRIKHLFPRYALSCDTGERPNPLIQQMGGTYIYKWRSMMEIVSCFGQVVSCRCVFLPPAVLDSSLVLLLYHIVPSLTLSLTSALLPSLSSSRIKQKYRNIDPAGAVERRDAHEYLTLVQPMIRLALLWSISYRWYLVDHLA